MAGLLFWRKQTNKTNKKQQLKNKQTNKKALGVRFEGVQRRVPSQRKVKVIPFRGTEDRLNLAGANSGKSGTRNLETDRARAEPLILSLLAHHYETCHQIPNINLGEIVPRVTSKV